MKLYELAQDYQDVLDLVEETDSDLVPEDWLRVINIESAYETKVENVAKIIKTLEVQELAIRAEVDRLTKRRKSIEGRREWMKRYLASWMAECGREKVKGELLTVSLRKAPPSCQIIDADAVSEDWTEIVETKKIDRRGIIDNFKKTGEIPDGCDITFDKKTLQIR